MTPALRLRRATRGFSLIELMVAMSIGLILTLIIGQIFINSRAVFASTDNLSRLQENARFTFNLVSREIRSAGFRSDSRPIPDAALYLPGWQFTSIQGTDGGAGGADSITLRFQGNGTGSAAANADGTVQDCLGTRVPYATTVTNTFLIQADPANNNEPTLYCNTDPVAPTICGASCFPLVPGVESMQILYGEDFTDWTAGASFGSTDGSADRWLTAAAFPPTVGATAVWANVVSVRIMLVMRTADRIADRPGAAITYRMNTANPQPTNDVTVGGGDRRLRRMFTTVINLRNNTQ